MSDLESTCGFPSSADDHRGLDLNHLLIKNKEATFFLRAKGSALNGIFQNDILIVDRSLEAKNNQIVIATIDGEFLLRRLHKTGNRVLLLADGHRSIKIKEEMDFKIWGVVKYSIHKLP